VLGVGIVDESVLALGGLSALEQALDADEPVSSLAEGDDPAAAALLASHRGAPNECLVSSLGAKTEMAERLRQVPRAWAYALALLLVGWSGRRSRVGRVLLLLSLVGFGSARWIWGWSPE